MKKDILFLCQYFYPEHNSSATLPFDTAKYLACHGFSVDALVGYPKEYSDANHVPIKEIIEGVGIHRIRYIQLKRGKRLSRLINYFSFTVSGMLRLFKLRNYKSVIVYSNPPVLPFVAVLANMLFGTKIVFVAYDVYPEVAYASNSIGRGSLIDKGMCWINRMMYQRVSRVVSLTDEMKDFLIENRPQLQIEKVITIANWAHEKKSQPDAEAYEAFGYHPEQFVVSYFGNMGICQDMDTLLNAARRLKDDPLVRFLFVGHGAKKDSVAQIIRNENLTNVQLLDFLTGKKFEQAVAVSSCCVVTLERGIKGMCAPSKFYSYLQGGKPVIAVVEQDSYLEQEVLKEQIGSAVALGEDQRLAQILSDMARDPQQCTQMGKRAEDLYNSQYAMEIGLDKYKKMFDSIL